MWASCADDLAGVRVPLLCINADDDPIVSQLPFDEVQDNEGGWVAMVITQGGGHLGWFEKEAKRRWISKPVVEWMRALAEEVVWPKTPAVKGEIREEEDGFVRLSGEDPHVGYRILSTGGDTGNTDIPGALKGL